MGIDRTVHACAVQCWPAAQMVDARGMGCDPIQYIAAGCQSAMPPKDFPPFTTVQHYFYWLRNKDMLDIINETLVISARLLADQAAEPTAG